MTTSFEYEKRDYIRLPISVAVKYTFLSQEVSGPEIDTIHEGTTSNIGSGGLMLTAELPDTDWLGLLLTRRMHVGVKIFLPGSERPAKSLCRAAWASALDDKGGLVLGLCLQEITQEDRDRITSHIIEAQLPGE